MAEAARKRVRPVLGRLCLVACGSFNPPTVMHLRMLEMCRDALTERGYEVTGGYLSPVGDGYRKKGLLPAAHRLAMCRAAADESDWIKCDAWEAEQREHIMTRVVLERFQERVDGRVVLACGADLLQSMLTPGVWSDEDLEIILGKYGVACLERADLADLTKLLDETPLFRKHRDNIYLVKQPIYNNVSSTIVRNLVRTSGSIRYLVPHPVERYIRDSGLYLDDPSHASL